MLFINKFKDDLTFNFDKCGSPMNDLHIYNVVLTKTSIVEILLRKYTTVYVYL